MPLNYATPQARAAEAALMRLRDAAQEQEISFSEAVGALAERLTELMVADATLMEVRRRVARVLRG